MEHLSKFTVVSDSKYSPKQLLFSGRIRNREDRSSSRKCTQLNNIQKENNLCLIVGLQEYSRSFNRSRDAIIHEFPDRSDHFYLNTYTLHSNNLVTSREMEKRLRYIKCQNTTR
jgi:hypothetical protein